MQRPSDILRRKLRRTLAPRRWKTQSSGSTQEANFKRFASQDSIRYYLDRTVECGFNHIVVDVRPISGTVLYESDMLEPLTVVGPDTVRRDWDYLQCFLDEARKRELKVTPSRR